MLALVLAGAWVLRASPFFRPTGVLGWPVDSDEGVYLSAAHALTQGEFPWRDFVFLHPPGILLAFSPLTVFDPSTALTVTRLAMTLVGTLNTTIIFFIVRSKTRFPPALLACVLYATWHEVVIDERQAFIEPLLNLACLALTLAVVRRWPAAIIGTLIAVALSFKAWATFWVVGALVASSSPKDAARRAGWAAPFAVALLLGFVLRAPAEAFHQLLQTHALRPPDGDLDRAVRLNEMFIARNPLPILLFIASLPMFWKHRAEPLIRMLMPVFVLVTGSFLTAAAFWNQYDAHLAAVLAPLAGLGAGLWSTSRERFDTFGIVAALACAYPGTITLIARRHDAQPEQLRLAKVVATQTNRSDRVCGLDLNPALMGDRWPSPPYDGYGQELSDSTRIGRFLTPTEAFALPPVQAHLLEQFERCTVLIPSDRYDMQMPPESLAQLKLLFHADDSGLLRRN